MRNFIFLLLVTFAVCLSAEGDKTLYEETTYNKPTIRAEAEVYLGDRMLIQQVGAWKECITPRKTFTKKSMGWTFTYKGGQPICKEELSDKYYWPGYANAKGSGEEMTVHVRWKEKKGKYSLCQDHGMWSYCVKKLSENDVESGSTFIFRPNSFQQTIAYAGRSGDILKFDYAEFSGGFARQAFSREFQIDLNEGNIAAYKGAIIEVIEANNMQIKYKVIRNFSSDL